MSKKLVIFDLDGVVVKGQSQKLFIWYLFKKNKVGVAYLIKMGIIFELYKWNFVKDLESIRFNAVKVFKGWTFESVKEIFESFFIEVLQKKLNLNVIEFVNTEKLQENCVIIISASLEGIVAEVASYLKIDVYAGVNLELIDGSYTGRLCGTVPYAEGKVKVLNALLKKYKIHFEKVVVYTDHKSDLPLIAKADEVHIISPDKELKKISEEKGWAVYDFS